MNLTVVIPIHKLEPDKRERISLERVVKVLDKINCTAIVPESLNISYYTINFPTICFEKFPDKYFVNIDGYNRLMLSEQFYSRFEGSEYILIYQLDSYIFRNDLEFWCKQGYDYIGAPWVKREEYNSFLIGIYLKAESLINKLLKRPDRTELFNLVGNGGFSLRKTSSHLNAVRDCKEEIDDMLSKKRHHMYNEDVFFSYHVNRVGKVKFSYPSWESSLMFSFDKNPDYCFRLNGERLPMACHGWTKKRFYPFWEKYIK